MWFARSMLPVSVTTIRLYLHVLAATVWVGGQITLAGLVPGLRSVSPEAPGVVARQFNRIAWPAFVALVLTGLWNLAAVHVGDQSSAYLATLFAKLVVVAVSGVSAAFHAGARSCVVLVAWGAASGVSALGALFLGVQLNG